MSTRQRTDAAFKMSWPAQRPDLPFQLGDAPGVDVGLIDPVAQRFWADAELAGDPLTTTKLWPPWAPTASPPLEPPAP